MSLLDLGIASAVSRYVARYHIRDDYDKLNRIVNSAFLLFIIITTFIVILSPLTSSIILSLINIDASLRDTVRILIIIVSFDISIFILTGLFRGSLAGFQRFDVINITILFSSFYKAVLFYVFLSGGHGLITMSIISLTANLLISALYYYYIKSKYSFFRLGFRLISKESIKKVFSHSNYTFLAMVANQVIYYSDAFVIGYFMNTASITYYSIAWSLTEYVKRFSIAFSRAFVPAFSSTDSSGNNLELNDLFISGTKFMMILSNLLCIGFIIVGGDFISLWMGEEYRDACTPILMILFVSQIFLGPQLISYALLQGTSKHKAASYVSVFVSITSLLLSIYLINHYGLIGVALGTAIPQIIFNGFIFSYLATNSINCSFYSYICHTYLKVLPPTVILGLFLYILSNVFTPTNYLTLLVEALTSSLLYLIFIYYFSLSSNEKKYVNNKLMKSFS